MKKIVCMLCVAVILALCVMPAMAINIRGVTPGMTLYVKTSGGNLNLRETPTATATKIAKIPYGASVVATDEYKDGYLQVVYNNGKTGLTGWVDVKYLSADKPPKQGGSSEKTDKTEPQETVASLNFKSFKLVPAETTYIVAAKPSRAGGFVNLRWVPSTQSAVIERMYAGEEMTVIAEGKTWLQVMCADGYVGFIVKQYTSVVYNGSTEAYEALLAAQAE